MSSRVNEVNGENLQDPPNQKSWLCQCQRTSLPTGLHTLCFVMDDSFRVSIWAVAGTYSTPSDEVIRRPEVHNVSQRRRRQRRTDQVTATDNIRYKFGEGRMCGCGDTFADRQTDTRTCSSQYSATPSGCGVINRKCCTGSGNGVICNCIPARFPL